MKFPTLILPIITIFLAGCVIKTEVAIPTNSDEYQLVWSDEFLCNRILSNDDWGYEKGFVRNEENQWYQPDNAFCHNGNLVLEAREVDIVNPNYEESSNSWRQSRQKIKYTSASINTKGKHAWLYGRFEVRAKIPAYDGMWPAIWFLGVDGEWPSNGEIDLMEYYRGMILANGAWGTDDRFKARWDDKKVPLTHFKDKNWAEKFHVWRMDWNEDFIKLYVDNELLNTVDLSQTINSPNSVISNPFHQPQYLLLNLAIGGSQGGDPSNTKFPQQYKVDYVRVYQKK